MSTLADRRAHKFPAARRFGGPGPQPWWRDFLATLIFAAFGLAVTAFALVERIPLVGDDIWSG